MLMLSAFIREAFPQEYAKDVFPGTAGNIEITFIAHATLMIQYDGKTYHIDPVTMFGTDYSKMPKADFILITHSHGDHMDAKAIDAVKKDNTVILASADVVKNLGTGISMANGDVKEYADFTIKAVPAYNLASSYQPKGVGNGYVLNMGDKNIYIAGDTENIPEMAELKNIDVAFLPMNRPYTMTPEMLADAAVKFRPGILYPYHYSDTNTDEIVKLLAGGKDIEVRIRKF